MLVNARFAKLVFVEVLWPDFTFMDMVHAIWQYQRGAGDLKRARGVRGVSGDVVIGRRAVDGEARRRRGGGGDSFEDAAQRRDETDARTPARDVRARKRRARLVA